MRDPEGAPLKATGRKATIEAVIFKRWIQHCVRIPKKSFGIDPPIVPLPVVVRLGRDAYESTLSSQDRANYNLVVPVAFLRDRGLGVGDALTLVVEPDLGRQAPELPPDFETFLRQNGALFQEFKRMTIASQRQIVKYVSTVASERARVTRMEVMAERLRDRIAARRKRDEKARRN